MIIQKDFYFLRHGQTDGNLDIRIKMAGDDVPLNATGVLQAKTVEPLIAGLPIRTICCSPLKRAKETKEIACVQLKARHLELNSLGECRPDIWKEMTMHGAEAVHVTEGPVAEFMQNVRQGLNEALSFEGPVLIVGHGGFHWAICCLMQIEGDWVSPNCSPRHFSFQDGKWQLLQLAR